MKILLLFSLLLVKSSLSQEIEHIKVGKEAESIALFPHIGSYYQGEIPISVFDNPAGIQVGKGWDVISFSISYSSENQDKTSKVKGYAIPQQIVRDIFANSLGQMVFITNIVAVDTKGNHVNIIPMNLIPVR